MTTVNSDTISIDVLMLSVQHSATQANAESLRDAKEGFEAKKAKVESHQENVDKLEDRIDGTEDQLEAHREQGPGFFDKLGLSTGYQKDSEKYSATIEHGQAEVSAEDAEIEAARDDMSEAVDAMKESFDAFDQMNKDLEGILDERGSVMEQIADGMKG